MVEIEEYKKFGRRLADLSGEVICKYFRTNFKVDLKEDESPVTIADKKAEEIMREEIMKNFPSHGIIGEEFGEYNPDSKYKWILDPIDGTKSFICGSVTFGTLIALMYNGIPVLGIINQPVLNEFLIGDNQTCELNNRNVKVRNCAGLAESVLLTTDHRSLGQYKDASSFNELIKQVKIYRNWGDCYGYYLVATGFADIMVDPKMSVWDLMALIPVIRGAGGIITDYEGNDPVKGESAIACSSSDLHKQVIEILNP